MTLDSSDRVSLLASYAPRALQSLLGPEVATEPPSRRFLAAALFIDISGFSPLAAAAAAQGAGAVEKLSQTMNAYFGAIIDVVASHDGDIVKFLGDALLAIWPVSSLDELPAATARAAIAALSVAKDFGESNLDGRERLLLKTGLCAGEVIIAGVGGVGGRRLLFVAGSCIGQLSGISGHMRPGDVVASPQAWAGISDRFLGQALGGGPVRLHKAPQDRIAKAPASPPLPVVPDELLRPYVHEPCLTRIEAGQADWLGEFRRTTVLFANVEGVQEGTAEGLAQVHELAKRAMTLSRRYGGWPKKITVDEKGTTLVVVFGVPPFAHEDDPARALELASALSTELSRMALLGRIGVTTGMTFAGPVGNDRRRDFVLVGHHVNLASRLMKTAGHAEILCDTATRERAGNKSAFDRLAAFVLKGLAAPVDVYRAFAHGPSVGRQAVTIDRTDELTLALRRLDALRHGKGGLLAIEGEPGIGKSRFAAEVVARARSAGITCLIGAAEEIEMSTPYHVWRGLLEQLFGVQGIGERATRRNIVVNRLGSRSAADLAPLLDPILLLDIPQNPVTTQLSGEVRASNTHALIVGVLAEEIELRPMMLVVEDVHWLDAASWSLLVDVSRGIPSLLLLFTGRQAGLAKSHNFPVPADAFDTLSLGGLAPEYAVALACERTGATRLSDPVAQVVQQRAEGNPLFIEQLTFALRDSGRIVVDDGLVRLAPGVEALADTIIPDTVHRVITSRLDQLPPAVSMTLKVASVIGPRFMLRTLLEVYPFAIEYETIGKHLDILIQMDLVVSLPGPERTYSFKHIITQEVAYNLMLSAQSQQLHGRVADWYERTYSGDLAPFHGFLAHHWRKAGETDKAIGHLEQAAEQALNSFANDEAIASLEDLLTLAKSAGVTPARSRQARWHLQLGEAYVHMSNYREGRPQLEAGLRLMGHPVPTAGPLTGLALGKELALQVLRRWRLAYSAREISTEQRDRLVAACRAYERLAEASFYAQESLVPLYCVIRILNEAEKSGSPPQIARGFAGSGALFGVIPFHRIARSYLAKALKTLQLTDDLTTKEIVELVAGFYYLGAGGWADARQLLHSVRTTAVRLGDRRRHHDAITNLLYFEAFSGSFSRSFDHARELTESARAMGDQRFIAEGLIGIAHTAWQLDRRGDVSAALGELRSILAQRSDLPNEVQINAAGAQALVHLTRGDAQQALANADGLRRLTSARPTYFGAILGFATPVEVYLDLSATRNDGRKLLGDAAAALRRLKAFSAVFPIGRPRYETLAGTVDWARGRHGRAVAMWNKAVQSARALAMPYEEALALYELGRHETAREQRHAALGKAMAILATIDGLRLRQLVESAMATSK